MLSIFHIILICLLFLIIAYLLVDNARLNKRIDKAVKAAERVDRLYINDRWLVLDMTQILLGCNGQFNDEGLWLRRPPYSREYIRWKGRVR